MQGAVRNCLAAGVALVGAGAIAVSPVAPPVPDVVAVSPAVRLSAAVDPITPWLDVFNTAEVNFADLVDNWLEAPAPVLQQVIANQLRYLGELPDFPAIVEQVAANVQAAIRAPFAQDLSTLSPDHANIYDLLLNGLPPIIDPVVPADLAPLVRFSTTYLSGMLLGLVGPVINPALALGGSLQSVIDNLTSETPDLQAAFDALINTPAAMTNSFLNGGQSVDITPLLTAVGIESPIPGLDFSARLVFGGLLSPGGSIFDAMSIDLGDGSGPTGVGPGAIGSLIGLTKAIAEAIGWDGSGNPLAPPVPDETLPAISPAAATPITETPDDAATLVSLDVTPTSETAEAGATVEPATAEVTDVVVDETLDSDDADVEPAKADPLSDIRDGIEGTVKDVHDRLDDLGAAFGPRETPAKADSTESESAESDSAESESAESDSAESDSETSRDKGESTSKGGAASDGGADSP